ncbi:MAG: hypothetical protein V3T53_04585 [Phycisphaerales bacterium]
MNKLVSRLTVTIAGLALATIPTNTLADHIDGHDNCDPVFPVPIPGEEHFTGGVLFVTLIGPVEDDIITNTTFDITYVSDGATPASEIQLHGTVQVDKDLAEFIVTGADLGFGSGSGTFKGTFSTDALNGVAWPGFLPPYSIVDLQIDAVNGGIQGYAYFVDSFINFDVIPAPPCAPPCPADLDDDGNVGASDLLTLLASWGPCKDDCPADFNGDGNVGASDLLALLANWGPCP